MDVTLKFSGRELKASRDHTIHDLGLVQPAFEEGFQVCSPRDISTRDEVERLISIESLGMNESGR